MERVKRLNEMEQAAPAEQPTVSGQEYPVYYVVKRFCYDREHRNGYWREETMLDTVAECENYIKSNSYNGKGETGRFGIYRTQLVKLVGEE